MANPIKGKVEAGCRQFANHQLILQAGQSHFSENPIITQSLEGSPGVAAQLPVRPTVPGLSHVQGRC